MSEGHGAGAGSLSPLHPLSHRPGWVVEWACTSVSLHLQWDVTPSPAPSDIIEIYLNHKCDGKLLVLHAKLLQSCLTLCDPLN